MALVVLTGGARSGKSTVATELASRRLAMVAPFGRRAVAVVFGDGTADEEMAGRIEQHRRDRPAAFDVLEPDDPTGWLDAVGADAVVLLDCLGSLLGRLITAELDPPGREAVDERFSRFVESLVEREGDTVVVTNEVGDGVVPAYPSGRLFRDLLGRANRTLVDHADAAYLVVAGRLIGLTDLPRRAVWPED